MAMVRCAAMVLFTIAATGNAFAADLPASYSRHHRAAAPPPAEHDQDSLLSSLPTTPLLLGSSTLPGYYGRAFDYDYQGPYYGGPNPSYLFRLPYACGVYGYC